MKVIGIGGYSCTGKSTLARFISSYSDKSEIISLDFILNDIKRKIAKPEDLEYGFHGDGDLIRLKNNPFNNISNERINNIYLFARNLFVSGIINYKLFKLYHNNYELVVIEGVLLEAFYVGYDYLVKMESSDDFRIIRRLNRDGFLVCRSVMNEWDENDRLISLCRHYDYNVVINNNISLDDLNGVSYNIFSKVMK